jgi:AcrR family transcriptional regulator
MAAQREKILRAAFVCVAENGVEGTSITDICSKAELSRGALYVHFQNKDEIIVETLRFGMVDIQSLPTEWEDFKAALFEIDQALGFNFETIIRNRFHLAVEAFRPGILRETLQQILARHHAKITDALEAMVANGSIKSKMDVHATTFAIGVFFDGTLWAALAIGKDLRELRQQLNDGLDCFVERLR